MARKTSTTNEEIDSVGHTASNDEEENEGVGEKNSRQESPFSTASDQGTV